MVENNYMLFVTSRPSRAEEVYGELKDMENKARLEQEWALRLGIKLATKEVSNDTDGTYGQRISTACDSDTGTQSGKDTQSDSYIDDYEEGPF